MSDIQKRVTDIAAEVKHAEIAAADLDKPLKDLGLDSLDIANMLLVVEEQFGLKIPDADVQDLSTLAAIVRYVEARAPSKT